MNLNIAVEVKIEIKSKAKIKTNEQTARDAKVMKERAKSREIR